jgi:hypothetical protein
MRNENEIFENNNVIDILHGYKYTLLNNGNEQYCYNIEEFSNHIILINIYKNNDTIYGIFNINGIIKYERKYEKTFDINYILTDMYYAVYKRYIRLNTTQPKKQGGLVLN